jgi:hypothetical protein
MAEITDQTAINFVNENVRTMAEKLRAAHYLIDSFEDLWFAGVNATVPNSADDAFVRDGLMDLTGADVHGLMASFLTAKADIAGALQLIEKASVRPLRIDQ